MRVEASKADPYSTSAVAHRTVGCLTRPARPPLPAQRLRPCRHRLRGTWHHVPSRTSVVAGPFVEDHAGLALHEDASSSPDARDLASLSYVRGATDLPLLDETMGACLERAAATYSEREAVVSVHQRTRLTYAELLAQASEAARGLLALGVQREDRVAIWAPNCIEWTVLQYATALVGAVLVNVNPSYSSSDLQYALTQCGVSVLVMASELRGNDFVTMVAQLEQEGQLPALRHKVVLGTDVQPGCLSWDGLRRLGDGEGLAAALDRRKSELRPEDPANIQYTSGTTGYPKAATLSHRNLLNNALFIGEACCYTEADRICVPVPLFHCFGMVIGNLAALTHGSCVVYPSSTFAPEATLRAVEVEACTSLYGVPAMFIQELEHPHFARYKLDSLRTGVMAGSPCPVEVMKRVQRDMHMSEVTICYGMTETSPVSFQSSTDDPVVRRVSTVGRVHPHLEAKVADPRTGELVPRGAVGELCVRGYSVMLGYWGDEAATSMSIDKDGWMHTGDLGTLDDEGYCNIVGRQKDMVIRAGENISPREVEEFLFGHPAVADVQVFGVPDLKRGEALCAWVKLREASKGAVGVDDLRAWCNGQIAAYKVPRHWKLVDAFPMTVSGKPQKFRMREAMVQELGLQQAASVRTA